MTIECKWSFARNHPRHCSFKNSAPCTQRVHYTNKYITLCTVYQQSNRFEIFYVHFCEGIIGFDRCLCKMYLRMCTLQWHDSNSKGMSYNVTLYVCTYCMIHDRYTHLCRGYICYSLPVHRLYNLTVWSSWKFLYFTYNSSLFAYALYTLYRPYCENILFRLLQTWHGCYKMHTLM